MEEKYPELKNLMPRDVVSREMYFVSRDNENAQVYLDMTGLSKEVWSERLPDLREEIIHYLGIDPKNKPIPVSPGIHYFMGGIDVDIEHKTNVENLFAAGECCLAYHGANRLGGNSLLGAIYGGRKAAETVIALIHNEGKSDKTNESATIQEITTDVEKYKTEFENAKESFIIEVRDILFEAMGIVRNEKMLSEGLAALDKLSERNLNERETDRLRLAKALILSALYRKESRGANYREDYPERNDEYKGMTRAIINSDTVNIEMWRTDGSIN